MKMFVVSLVGILSLATASTVLAKTVLPTTAKDVEAQCGAGKHSCYQQPCGSTTCNYKCDKDSKCTVTIFLKVPPKSGVTGHKTNGAAEAQPAK